MGEVDICSRSLSIYSFTSVYKAPFDLVHTPWLLGQSIHETLNVFPGTGEEDSKS